ncbi:MAG TPA: YbaB/EbfC family nucleoid-associated protein [Candidatus Limnocylindrales bacterium]|nr:YbaB/EbfC family nucleoid-associated protein [Candidatus Limnocylindrales bacterium]
MSNFDFELDLDFDEIERQQRRIEEIERAVMAMEVIGRSRRGEVTAVVKGTGQFTKIKIDPRLDGRQTLEAISILVLEAVNDGVRKLNEVTRKRFEPLISAEPGVG